jgi:diadenosine tetraphosphate (Ap4A) HIT family hydrolase
VKAALLVLFAVGYASADVSNCACDPARPETMAPRQCGLCREAEEHPAGPAFFFLKDNNPRKPNRWLILPRAHHDGPGPLAKLSPAERTQMWRLAIERARQLWGDGWGVAYNGDRVRTQCHMHLHIGRLLRGIETDRFVVVSGPDRIPVPDDGTGLWIHPAGNKLHVHLGEHTTETVLFR